MYVAGKNQWRQTWADRTGTFLVLEGGMRGGSMQMAGPGYRAGAQPSLNRVTWTPHSDGSVRQLSEVSADEGKTWSVVFDGRHTRAM